MATALQRDLPSSAVRAACENKEYHASISCPSNKTQQLRSSDETAAAAHSDSSSLSSRRAVATGDIIGGSDIKERAAGMHSSSSCSKTNREKTGSSSRLLLHGMKQKGTERSAAKTPKADLLDWLTCNCERTLFYGSFVILGAVLLFTQFIPLPILVQMVVYTGTILYIGSHSSLRQNEVDACTGERANRAESMNHTDALLFPIFGSAALITLYVAYKFLDASWVNFLLTGYLTGIGFFALGETIHMALLPVFPRGMVKTDALKFRLRMPHIPLLMKKHCEQEEVTEQQRAAEEAACTYSFSYAQLSSFLCAAALSSMWLWCKHWAIHNMLAIAFCIQAIGLVSLGNFTVAAILLCGLFVYDIFWVFGTDVMVTVAKSFEGPAKLIFPIQLDPWQQSILGLGDVVVPGVFISMCLRFDHWLSEARHLNNDQSSSCRDTDSSTTEDEGALAAGEEDCLRSCRRNKYEQCGPLEEPQATATSLNTQEDGPLLDDRDAEVIVHQRFSKFYFWIVLIFYECGLLTTGSVMYIFQHPQPALLYLVPFCLFSLFGTAALNGQVKEVLAYREDDGNANENAAGAAALAVEHEHGEGEGTKAVTEAEKKIN